MRRCATVSVLTASISLAILAGCGTRSILVPVTRHADINLAAADTVLVLPAGTPDRHPFSIAVASRIDSLLPVLLSSVSPVVIRAETRATPPRMFTADGDVSRRSLRWWSALYPGELMLVTDILHGRYHEMITAAAIRSTRTPGSVKNVRQGRADALCRVVLLDTRRERVLFDDTLHTTVSSETHAADSIPPPLDERDLANTAARELATHIHDASHPVSDHDVVTFLVDDDYPEIDIAIRYAEEGRWPLAADVLRTLTADTERTAHADIVWYDLGLVLRYMERFKDALDALDRAIAIRDRGRYRHARAAVLESEHAFLERLQRTR
ncbi:MAG: tetratricopeptide repeat protein [Bacteroidota bacterium]|jgi:hypothetical protein|nr:tetratricopeptide repeat protein [Bacteroidota bacterium]